MHLGGLQIKTNIFPESGSVAMEIWIVFSKMEPSWLGSCLKTRCFTYSIYPGSDCLKDKLRTRKSSMHHTVWYISR